MTLDDLGRVLSIQSHVVSGYVGVSSVHASKQALHV